eukprot:1744974-Rhodomonas_salina.3
MPCLPTAKSGTDAASTVHFLPTHPLSVLIYPICRCVAYGRHVLTSGMALRGFFLRAKNPESVLLAAEHRPGTSLRPGSVVTCLVCTICGVELLCGTDLEHSAVSPFADGVPCLALMLVVVLMMMMMVLLMMMTTRTTTINVMVMRFGRAGSASARIIPGGWKAELMSARRRKRGALGEREGKQSILRDQALVRVDTASAIAFEYRSMRLLCHGRCSMMHVLHAISSMSWPVPVRT